MVRVTPFASVICATVGVISCRATAGGDPPPSGAADGEPAAVEVICPLFTMTVPAPDGMTTPTCCPPDGLAVPAGCHCPVAAFQTSGAACAPLVPTTLARVPRLWAGVK